ncbi:MAG TPA: peptidase S10 [Casimicrobiaceae bacterium]|nr:peptidase S10 [Casimicrobiaceae bacterium]
MPPAPQGPAYFDSTIYSTAATASLAQANELAAVTQHQIVVGGAPLPYTATTGHLTASHPTSGVPEASFFYVAYTLPNRDPAARPVTFFYNGGPGSATVWLHLGSFGPKRLATGDPSTTAPTPFPLVDNAETLLDISDLVFVDAVGTGLSEAIAPSTNQSYWSVDADAAVFRDFILRYLAVNHRSASPLFLFGESYGTTRTGVLAFLLGLSGARVSGVILQSSALDYNAFCDVAISCAGFVPTYGAIGAYYNLEMPNPPDADLPAFVARMRTFTASVYDPAVMLFLNAGTLPGGGLLDQLAATTGMSAANWQAHFNLPPDFYQGHLLPGILIGRYDARVSAPMGSALAREGDPSSTFITASFANAIGTYLANDLQYTNPSTYVMLSNAIATWSFSHDGLALPDVVPDLAAALAQNPELHVIALNGYHDLATPFFQTERDLARLGNLPNVQTTFYRGGHMTYLDDRARAAEKADLVQFYRRATVSP